MEHTNTPTLDFDAEQQELLDRLTQTNDSVFLTGVAGCGKSTLIRHFLDGLDKEERSRTAVLAPTGLAAVNVGGATIHSFFGLRIGAIDPDEFKVSGRAIDRLMAVDTIVIDEVSMVRADIFTAMDASLRQANPRNRFDPFGGVRIIMVGDLLQLPPVVVRDESLWMKKNFGHSEGWFFISPSYKELAPVKYNLTKSYRQKGDTHYVELLNRVREDDRSVVADLNAQAQTDCDDVPPTAPILAARNSTVHQYNRAKLAELNTRPFTIQPDIEGDVSDRHPVNQALHLAQGARVMATRNAPEGAYVNGSLGTYKDIREDHSIRTFRNNEWHTTYDTGLVVDFDRTGQQVVVPAVWEIIKYKTADRGRKLNPVVVGTIKQYPLVLAWSLTIHKSQGQGFEAALLDASDGLFSPGQLYVALSRVESLKGLYLKAPLMPHDLITSTVVCDFLED